MKKKVIQLVTTVCMATMLWGLTVFAAPQQMADGGIFDPQFYAQTYPDVVAALGTDPNTLYQHYLQFGKAEGRQPYAPGSSDNAAAAPTVMQTLQYDNGICGARDRILKALETKIMDGDVITLQIHSDGTIYMTRANLPDELDVFAQTGRKNGDLPLYRNIASTKGKPGDKYLFYNDAALGIIENMESPLTHVDGYLRKGLID